MDKTHALPEPCTVLSPQASLVIPERGTHG